MAQHGDSGGPSLDPARLGLPVLALDRHTVVVVKPAGMATELTSDPKGVSLVSRLRRAAAPGVRVRLVHRLDRATRGVMIATLSQEAAAFYGAQIREGLWEKYYVARIPMPPDREARLRLLGPQKGYIREEDGPRARLVRAGGKPSLQEVLAVEAAPGRAGQAHALIKLVTGRLHQIRVMMAGAGYPLIGDPFYGGAPGEMYLEHIALWYVDYATRDVRLAHLHSDPEREALAPVMRKAVDRILRPLPLAP